MSGLLGFFWQIGLAIAGFVAAAIAAAFVIIVGLHAAPAWIVDFGMMDGSSAAGPWMALDGAHGGSTIVAAVIFSTFVGAFAFLPALAAIVVAEIFRIRGFLYFLAVGVAIAVLARATGFGPDVPPDGVEASLKLVYASLLPTNDAVLVAAGAAGGLVYWIVAGRRSGRWRAVRQDQASQA